MRSKTERAGQDYRQKIPLVCGNLPSIEKQLKRGCDFPIIVVIEGGDRMQIEIKIDSSCTEPKIIVMTASMSEDIHNLVKRLSENSPQIISGMKDDKLEVLEQSSLIRIYASAGKVFAVTDNGEYVVRSRLYELEERLDRDRFVRISNSEIINLKKVKNFDLSFTGTICVIFLNGTVTYVSRRYVAKIRKILGI